MGSIQEKTGILVLAIMLCVSFVYGDECVSQNCNLEVSLTISGGIIGNESDVTDSGLSNLTLFIDGQPLNDTPVTGFREFRFEDDIGLISNFTYNLSESSFYMSEVQIIRESQGILVNFSGQVTDKAVYLIDLPSTANYTSICAIDEEVSSLADLTETCTGPNQINFFPCIQNGAGVTLDNVTCSFDGTRYVFTGLQNSGIKGFYGNETEEEPPTGGGGGGGGGGDDEPPVEEGREELPIAEEPVESPFSRFIKDTDSLIYLAVALLLLLALRKQKKERNIKKRRKV